MTRLLMNYFYWLGGVQLFYYTPLSIMNKSIVALVNKFEKNYSKWWFTVQFIISGALPIKYRYNNLEINTASIQTIVQVKMCFERRG